MKITKIRIENFRSIDFIEITPSDRTVFIGENNSGKSTILDAVRVALTRRWGKSGGTGFSEFDFRTDSKTGKLLPIEIVLEFHEAAAGEWGADVVASLNDIIRTHPVTGSSSIAMRVRCTFEEVSKAVEPEWQFLNEKGAPFRGRGGRNQNLQGFFDYVPSFSMAAIRDASGEYGNRSAYWMPLLKSIEVPEKDAAELEEAFGTLNSRLLGADPKIEAITESLKRISSVIAKGAAGDVNIRAVPARLWDIIRRSELVVQGQAKDPWLPISRHGNGVQSLSIVFLFRAYIENVLSDSGSASTPILALEEPEAHLHPQACRALWRALEELPGQTFITTHSPYFVQNVPFKDLVLLRRGASGPQQFRLARKFELVISSSHELDKFVAKYKEKYQYDAGAQLLVLSGRMTEGERRDLLKACASEPPLHSSISELARTSAQYIDDEEISKLESWAKRIRGEIFFARKWILCEGQAEYALIHAMAETVGMNLDALGISVIDYQNNGAPGAFAALARGLGFEWVMICDGDKGGSDHIKQLIARDFSQSEIDAAVVQLPGGCDLEKCLYDSGCQTLLAEVAGEFVDGCDASEAQVLAAARANKEQAAVRLAGKLRDAMPAPSIPKEFRKLLELIGDAS